MKLRIFMLLVALPILAAGCATLDYVGQSYPPTQDVALFYSEENVDREYTVIGELTATADMFVSTHKVQDQIVEKARSKGADAVVILGLQHYQSGQSSNYNETTTSGKDKKGKNIETTSGSSSTDTEEKKRIKALFIKYKAPVPKP
jgi:hypothetical protein